METEVHLPIWFVTGCSSGFGYQLGKAILARGWRAVLTARNPDMLATLVASAPERTLALARDVRLPDAPSAAVAKAVARFGRIDRLVNNAGYGYQSSVEEGDDAIVRDMFETNFFGLVRMTQAVLPIMRRQRSGHIFNIGSVAGVVGTASGAYYSASKFAVSGLSESMAAEVGPLGIAVTVVEPGPFRTEFGGSTRTTPPDIADYQETIGPLFAALKARSGFQQGDPARAAEAIINASLEAQPPRNLVLGAATVERIRQKLDAWIGELERYRQVSIDADFRNREACP